ncbi:PspA/IM30 family protein [Sphingomicrobium sp. GRR-S6-50]|uniref:PspA/IM30 family protein n=2 Tax=Sphingomicrobium sediminis TaxID=2950949 RepID=A0A9X2J0G2_9SPHN|nr:PspA/IM30 family protein [Sphingomicrobium sediminis]MCM8556238.1 PspA/IM30 family protein [Sphingomicrobium sediminis]
MLNGPIFTRARDIIAANVNDLLERADDPAKMIRMIILEMEEVLAETRATAARAIADLKEMRSAHHRLERLSNEWEERAGLALEKGREDLAKQALMERAKVNDMIGGIAEEMSGIEELLKGYEADIQRLQNKLGEARSRQASIANRIESAMSRARARELLYGERTEEAFARFDQLERRADVAEGHADAMGMGIKSLEDEFAELKAEERALEALEEMKKARKSGKGEQG